MYQTQPLLCNLGLSQAPVNVTNTAWNTTTTTMCCKQCEQQEIMTWRYAVKQTNLISRLWFNRVQTVERLKSHSLIYLLTEPYYSCLRPCRREKPGVGGQWVARFYSQNCMINNSFSALVCTLAKDRNAFRWWWERRRLPRRFGRFSLRRVNLRVSRVNFPWHAPCRAKPSLKQRSRHLQSQKGRKPRCDFPRVQRSMNSLSNSTVQFSELSHQAACLSCPFRNRWKRLPKKMRKLKRRQIQRHTWRLPRIHSAWGRTCLGQEHVKTWTCHRLAVSCSEVM